MRQKLSTSWVAPAGIPAMTGRVACLNTTKSSFKQPENTSILVVETTVSKKLVIQKMKNYYLLKYKFCDSNAKRRKDSRFTNETVILSKLKAICTVDINLSGNAFQPTFFL